MFHSSESGSQKKSLVLYCRSFVSCLRCKIKLDLCPELEGGRDSEVDESVESGESEKPMKSGESGESGC